MRRVRGLVPSQPVGTLTEADGSSPEAANGAWTREVETVLGRVAAGEVDKVVLARALDFRPRRRLDPVELALALWSGNSHGHVFFFQPGNGTALVGASPEILAEVRGSTIRATAVAGSAPSPVSAAERRRFAARLLESAKERAEHDFVARHIEGALTDLGCRVRRGAGPAVLDLGAIQHLETEFTAEVPPSVTALDLLAVLHPTPAVCGHPRDDARAILKEAETFDREWYAGPVGWLASDGDARFVPALRSAMWRGDSWRLYAGAGIVAGSDPEREWEETELKFRPDAACDGAGAVRGWALGRCRGGYNVKGGELNFAWARAIVEVLVEYGIDEVEVAPGSRSAPLVLAALAESRLRVRVHLDERSAGFFAVGYARAHLGPAAVVTTSGTDSRQSVARGGRGRPLRCADDRCERR